jgi:hypothetical protein
MGAGEFTTENTGNTEEENHRLRRFNLGPGLVKFSPDSVLLGRTAACMFCLICEICGSPPPCSRCSPW